MQSNNNLDLRKDVKDIPWYDWVDSQTIGDAWETKRNDDLGLRHRRFQSRFRSRMWIALSVSETSLRHRRSIKRSRRKLPPLLNRLHRRLLESDRKDARRKKMKKTIRLRNHLPLRCCHVPTRDDTEKPLIKARSSRPLPF